MIQRIQTIFLVLVAALMSTLFFVLLANLNSNISSYAVKIWGVVTLDSTAQIVYPTWPLAAIAGLTILLPLVTIFVYSKRMLQIKLCRLNNLLIIAFYLLFGFYLYNACQELTVSFSPLFPLVTPLVALLLNGIAIRRIRADEMLIRSADRIR